MAASTADASQRRRRFKVSPGPHVMLASLFRYANLNTASNCLTGQ